MRVYLSKPGGRREGPFTLDQINRDLAARRCSEADYWAWYDGLTEWIPLHSVPGVVLNAESQSTPPETAPAAAATLPLEAEAAEDAGSQPTAQAERPIPPSLQKQLSSGLPFEALEHIFVLSTGDMQPSSGSNVMTGMLEQVVGKPLELIRQQVPRDFIARCDFLERLRGGGAIPDLAWRALANLKPELVKQAREGAYRVCVRTFPVETGEITTLALFYNKQKLEAA